LEWIDDFFPDERQDFQAVSAAANTRLYPLGGRIQPYALAGLGIIASVVEHRDRDSSIKQSNADWGFRTGAGVDFYLTGEIALSLEAVYVSTVGDIKDTDHVSIGMGILYRF
jgi:opacity protein-like surface antigen